MQDLIKLSDEELASFYKEGKQVACDILLERYKPLVSKLSAPFFLIGGEKEDLIQEGMIGLFRAITDFDPESGTFFSFAALCIKRQMIRAIENSNRKKHGPLNSYISIYNQDGGENEENYASKDTDPEQLFIESEDTRIRYERLMGALSGMEKEVFHLYMDGHDYHEIAAIMEKPEKSIDNCMQRIKNKAKEII